MTNFIHENFLLQTKAAERLYHDYAADMPIIDYHNHLSPKEIASNHRFIDITEIWLGGDHYKWRAMRSNGIPETHITGNAAPRERFRAWSATVPAALGNPLYHWTHLELVRYFGITDRLLGPDTADEIYDRCNEALQGEDFNAWSLLKRMKVEILATTDDPADSLEHHISMKEVKGAPVSMLPAWRPDAALKGENPEVLNQWIKRLEDSSKVTIHGIDDFKKALENRHEFFHNQGCRISDYGLETIPAVDYTEQEVSGFFNSIRIGHALQGEDLEKYRSAMLYFLAGLDAQKGWTMQLHFGVLRNNNTKMFDRLGPDTGFDSIGDFSHAKPLALFLDRLDREDLLPKTILYPIHPGDNEMVATMIGSFQDGSVPGKMQFGTAWWFLDQIKGMENQMASLSALGLLSRFVGMTTDSRSLLSYPRHEYFRRILCNVLGRDMERGLIPVDFSLVGTMIQDIAYSNAKGYFNFPQ